MFAALPYFGLGVIQVPIPGTSGLPIDPWFTLVCLGFVFGLEVGRSRALKMGLDVRDIVDGAVFIVLSGFFIGHVFTVLFYHPERLATDGIWAILRVWEGFSSMGGFIGAILGTVLFYGWLRPRPAWRHADVVTYGFPFGWFFGRLGCFVVHDHVGKTTDFPLGMLFPQGTLRAPDGTAAPWSVRHELGLYEAIYTLVICAVFVYVGRKDRPPGTFLALFAILYAPMRFFLDFLRNEDLYYQDSRYLGLTPGHYASLLMLLAGIWLWTTLDRKGFRPWALDGVPKDVHGEPLEASSGTTG